MRHWRIFKLVPGTRSNQCVVIDDDQKLHKNETGVKESSLSRGGRGTKRKEGREREDRTAKEV